MSDSTLPGLDTFRSPDTQANSDRSPALPFYLMSVDDAGRSTLAAELLRGFEQKSVGGSAVDAELARRGRGGQVRGASGGLGGRVARQCDL